MSGVRCQGVDVLDPETSYETTPKWHGFVLLRLAALAVELNSEPQNNEYRITNFEVWNRFAQSFYKIDRIHSFDIRYSLFIKFLSRLDWPLFWPAATLI